MSDILNVTVNQPSPSVIQLNVPGPQGKQGAAGIVQAGPLTITGLGDSEFGLFSEYQPTDLNTSSIPAWAPLTTYVKGNLVINGGNIYHATSTTGTSASSGGPTGTSTSITDGSVTWSIQNSWCLKCSNSPLAMVERLSLGQVRFDMSQGYGGPFRGLTKLIVRNGGSGYTAPTITLNNGATATLQVTGGVITGATVTNPGYAVTNAYTVTDATGSGAAFTIVISNGTFATPGWHVEDMVAALPDVVASPADIVWVLGGTNNLFNVQFPYLADDIFPYLQNCYETLVAAGKKVLISPVAPRANFTLAQAIQAQKLNQKIRDYAKKFTYINPNRVSVAIADPTHYQQDTRSGTGYTPYGGGDGSTPNTNLLAMTYEGVHQSTRGAFAMAHVALNAMMNWLSPAPTSSRTAYGIADAYDPVLNPRGNLMEGYPWAPSTNYTRVGGYVANGGNIYRLYSYSGNGTSASSGGPTGTGATIADGQCVWHYVSPSGLSVMGSGSAGTYTAATGVTISGSLPTGVNLARVSGSATGSVTCAINNPAADGRYATQFQMAFSLGSGGTSELWQLQFWNTSIPNGGNIAASDKGVLKVYAECELDLAAVANLNNLYLEFGDETVQFFNRDGSPYGTPNQDWPTLTDFLPYPNGDKLNTSSGRLMLRTQPMILPANMVNLIHVLAIGFDASGAAASALATIRLNLVAVRVAG